jgi:hypothetical protein
MDVMLVVSTFQIEQNPHVSEGSGPTQQVLGEFWRRDWFKFLRTLGVQVSSTTPKCSMAFKSAERHSADPLDDGGDCREYALCCFNRLLAGKSFIAYQNSNVINAPAIDIMEWAS